MRRDTKFKLMIAAVLASVSTPAVTEQKTCAPREAIVGPIREKGAVALWKSYSGQGMFTEWFVGDLQPVRHCRIVQGRNGRHAARRLACLCLSLLIHPTFNNGPVP